LFVLLAGCDFVFGVNGQPEPCELASFDAATATPIVDADEFSVDWDQSFAVFFSDGFNWQVELPDGEPRKIDLGIYNPTSFSLTPEGDALFFTAAIEPMLLQGALRDGNTWTVGARVPRGTYAGTPSADVFGPRRVLVKMLAFEETVQEYEDDNGTWVPIGEPLNIASLAAPNLTPNGLTMVYAGFDDEGHTGVLAQQRESVDEPFAPPKLMRMGDLRAPQLCGKCRQLYAIDNNQIVGIVTLSDVATTRGCAFYDRDDVASFGQFAVRPSHQSRGIGSKLLHLVESLAHEKGVGELALDTSEHATDLIAMYQAKGFRFIEYVQWKRPNYRSIVFSKTLRVPTSDL